MYNRIDDLMDYPSQASSAVSCFLPWHLMCEQSSRIETLVKDVKVQKTNSLVLVVDDDENLRNVIFDSLHREGIPCIVAKSVEEAITTLQANPVTMTLLDWGLRGHLDSSGVQVLDFCKERYPTMPVIVMSGQDFDVRTDSITRQADGFLQKPLSATIVTSLVRQWLNRLDNAPPFTLPKTTDDIVPLDEFKTLYIRHVLELMNYNISAAAEKLGIHRQTLAAALKPREGL